jgi:4-hydroxyacetophenone monooxygenase
VARITADGFVTDDARPHRADVIVFATGFEVTQMAARLYLTGRDGRALSDAWADENPAAYLGISVPGFPNLFCLQGPNTGLAHGGSAIFQSECQARHITGCIAALATAGATSIEAKPAAQDEWVAAVDAEHERLIWTHPGMSTYYRNRHGRIVSVMPWRLVDYWAMTHDPDLEAYEMR